MDACYFTAPLRYSHYSNYDMDRISCISLVYCALGTSDPRITSSLCPLSNQHAAVAHRAVRQLVQRFLDALLIHRKLLDDRLDLVKCCCHGC